MVSPQPPVTSKTLSDQGQVIISRFPIVESEFIPFKFGIWLDDLSYMGIMYVKIRIKDEYLLFFTSHMNCSIVTSDISKVLVSVEIRETMLELIRDTINVKLD
jgi:hypothetical protein